MKLSSNMTAQDCLDAGFEVGFTLRGLCMPDKAVQFQSTLDFGERPGNIVLRRDRCFAIQTRPAFRTDAPDDDPTWRSLLSLGGDGFCEKIGSLYLIRAFELGTFDQVKFGEISHGLLGGAQIVPYWLLPGGRIVEDALLEVEVVNGCDTIKTIPESLKAELSKVGSLRESWS